MGLIELKTIFNYEMQMLVSACPFEPELGTAQPQLVFLISLKVSNNEDYDEIHLFSMLAIFGLL